MPSLSCGSHAPGSCPQCAISTGPFADMPPAYRTGSQKTQTSGSGPIQSQSPSGRDQAIASTRVPRTSKSEAVDPQRPQRTSRQQSNQQTASSTESLPSSRPDPRAAKSIPFFSPEPTFFPIDPRTYVDNVDEHGVILSRPGDQVAGQQHPVAASQPAVNFPSIRVSAAEAAGSETSRDGWSSRSGPSSISDTVSPTQSSFLKALFRNGSSDESDRTNSDLSSKHKLRKARDQESSPFSSRDVSPLPRDNLRQDDPKDRRSSIDHSPRPELNKTQRRHSDFPERSKIFTSRNEYVHDSRQERERSIDSEKKMSRQLPHRPHSYDNSRQGHYVPIHDDRPRPYRPGHHQQQPFSPPPTLRSISRDSDDRETGINRSTRPPQQRSHSATASLPQPSHHPPSPAAPQATSTIKPNKLHKKQQSETPPTSPPAVPMPYRTPPFPSQPDSTAQARDASRPKSSDRRRQSVDPSFPPSPFDPRPPPRPPKVPEPPPRRSSYISQPYEPPLPRPRRPSLTTTSPARKGFKKVTFAEEPTFSTTPPPTSPASSEATANPFSTTSDAELYPTRERVDERIVGDWDRQFDRNNYTMDRARFDGNREVDEAKARGQRASLPWD